MVLGDLMLPISFQAQFPWCKWKSQASRLYFSCGVIFTSFGRYLCYSPDRSPREGTESGKNSYFLTEHVESQNLFLSDQAWLFFLFLLSCDRTSWNNSEVALNCFLNSMELLRITLSHTLPLPTNTSLVQAMIFIQVPNSQSSDSKKNIKTSGNDDKYIYI